MSEHHPFAGLDAADIEALVHARHGDPFARLGPHPFGPASQGAGEAGAAGSATGAPPIGAASIAADAVAAAAPAAVAIRVMAPGASAVHLLARDGSETRIGSLERIHPDGLFGGIQRGLPDPRAYLLEIDWSGTPQRTEDPYSFGALLSDALLQRLAASDPAAVLECLGARCVEVDGVPGVRFAVWAPNARRVSVVGDFNSWDGRRHVMRLRHTAGVWEFFVPRLGAGARYKYEIVARDGRVLPLKADPCAWQTERPPATASVVADARPFDWHDHAWMDARGALQQADRPLSIYEVHAESWLRVAEDGRRGLDWDELAERLVPYAKGMGFTHVEFMPIAEYPFGGSWGYQPLALFAPSARFGPPESFARFVDRAHQEGLGVLIDWVPAHFPNDAHGMIEFDGTPLYEHADPREGFHKDWNTMIYNLGRHEVAAFLHASALGWLTRYHVDGLRVDAVASMLYRDYSREAGEWVPNVYGGRENLEAIAFLRKLNAEVAHHVQGAITIAEESTAWPGVTAKVADGGLGFDYKWNMGWMHDTLAYMQYDPIHRRYHHHDMTFGMIYAYSERFVLPLSHDEVVYGKGSLLGKMPGDRWQKFANLRAYLAFMWVHPGKKLLFMGGEFGQLAEFNHDESPHWHLLDDPMHGGIQKVVRDLNRTYRNESALHARDAEPGGFEWLVGDDGANSVFAFARHDAHGRIAVAVCNFTPVPREGYRLGLPRAGRWIEALNTDAGVYGGSNMGNGGMIYAEEAASHGKPFSAALTLPPLATLVLIAE